MRSGSSTLSHGKHAVMTEQTDRSFPDGEPVDSIETDKSRIVVHELEEGWWILAVGLARDR